MAASVDVQYGLLYHMYLEMEKSEALKKWAGNFDALILISDKSKHCLRWRIEIFDSQVKLIDHGARHCFAYRCITSRLGCIVAVRQANS